MSVIAQMKENGAAITSHAAATLQRLRVLEDLYEQGYQDDVVDLTIHKLLEHQIQKDEAQLNSLSGELTKYEQQFSMPSEVFYTKYQAGEMGDDIDVFEWQVFYKMYLRLVEQLTILREHLGEMR